MELEQLRYFQQVAEIGTFSLAAIKLGISQPAISRQVQNLENELGLRLFYRHGRGVKLTEAGQTLYDTVTPLVAQIHEAIENLREGSREPTGDITLGMPSSIIGTIGSALVHRFITEYPKVKLNLYEGPSGLLLEHLESGALDIAVLYDARRGKNMLVTPLLLEDLFLITPPHMTMTQGSEVSLREVALHPLILPGPQSGLRRTVEHAAQSQGLKLNVMLEMHSVATIKNLVERGVGCTVLPYGVVYREAEDLRLCAHRIGQPVLRAKLVTATAAGQAVTRAMRAAQDIIDQEMRLCLQSGKLRGEILTSP